MIWMAAFFVMLAAFSMTVFWANYAIRKWDEYEDRDNRARLALARTLRDLKYQGDQGDGIDADLMPEFCRSCAVLGIVVNYPDADNEYHYTLTPTLTDWIQAHAGLALLPPMVARERR